MRKDQNRKRFLRTGITFLAVFLLAAVFFHLCYQYDNKHTAPGPQPMAGVLLLTESDLQEHSFVYLIRDWEIYRDKLLSPEDFVLGEHFPDEFTFIGQYGGFEGHRNTCIHRSPHGSATYRLYIILPPEVRSSTLELPEIFSAYRLYINNELMQEMGEITPNSYRAQTGITSVSVQAAGHMELLVAVSDFSHFYSGMVCPPAFGLSNAVSGLLNLRFGLRMAACTVAACIACLSLLIGLLSAKSRRQSPTSALPFLYAALCFSFLLSSCYLVAKTLIHGGMSLYRVENVAYCAMLLLVILIQGQLSEVGTSWTGIFAAAGAFVCCWALLLPLLHGGRLQILLLYSQIIGTYAWVCAFYLTFSTVQSAYHGASDNNLMLAGIAVFDAALVMDRLFPMFEPIRLGWFTELAGGVLILVIGAVMATEIALEFRLRQSMEVRTESISRMLDMHRTYHPILLEKETDLHAARHDLRHHISVLRELAMEGDLKRLSEYLARYDEQRPAPASTSYCCHFITDTLLRMYAGMAAAQCISFFAQAELPVNLPVKDPDICVILSNLLENALEASLRIPAEQRRIDVHIGCRLGRLCILIQNQFGGIMHMENNKIFSSKQQRREGLGLASVRATAGRYKGSADFYTDGKGVFCSEVFLPVGQDNNPERSNQ